MRALLYAVLVLAGTLTAQAQVVDLQQGQWLDLSHAYGDDTLYWPTADRFRKTTVFEGQTEGGFYYSAYDIQTAEHGGTHLDAPIHFAEGTQSVEQIPLQQLIGPVLVIDVSQQAVDNPDYEVSVADLNAWQLQHGPIAADDIVLIRTGFARHWPQAEKYLGTAERGPEAVHLLHFPGLSAAAAVQLKDLRIKAVGIDTASIDRGQSSEFMSHRILFAANIPALENLAVMDGVPERGAVIFALPMKIAGGSGAPLRVAVFVPQP